MTNSTDSPNLTLEQSFKLQTLTLEVRRLTKEQAQDYVIELIRQGMIKDNLFKQLLKEK
jgi:hypothetical protein